MTKFIEKALCLFYKTYDQLVEEAERRGMRHEGREKTIAKIIWKDAYDAGVVAGREISSAPPQFEDYCLYNIDEEKCYHLKLTKEQVRIIKWLQDMEFTQSVKFIRWDDQNYEDVGRI